jgi:hypothetical protein
MASGLRTQTSAARAIPDALMVVYADEITRNNPDAFDRSSPVFENIATAAKALAEKARP